MQKLKRVVIKEEFVALTGDYKLAVLLNQLIYWSERIKDFDDFIKEENKRMNNNDIDDKPIQLQHGWIYKKAEDLSSETMLGLSKQTIGRLLDKLCECGWIEKRRNPRYKWDKTYQYRVNIIKIAIDLSEKGYTLQDYKINFDMIPSSKMELQELKMELCKYKNGTAIPKITTEITKTENKINNGSFTNELVSFSTYVNNLSEDKQTEYSESINSIEYFIHIRDQKGFKECQYKSSTWEDIVKDWLNVSDVDEKLTVDESYDLIDKFFETKFKDCDYSPVFYCSGKIKANRYYELRRNKGEDICERNY